MIESPYLAYDSLNTEMKIQSVVSRMNNRLLHLGVESGQEELLEKDLYPWTMYLSFRVRKFIKHIPFFGKLIRRVYLQIRYGIRPNDVHKG